METVKETKEFTIYKKKNGRFAVKGANKKWINGEEKVKILIAQGLIKVTEKAAAAPEESSEAENDSGSAQSVEEAAQ